MVKLIIYFRPPADVDAFEDHFANRHVPLIAAMPNVVRSSVTRALGAPRGEPIFYLIHEVYFADLPAMTYALNSAQGRAAGADVMMFARDVVTLMYGEVWGEDPFEMMGSEREPVSELESADQTQTPDANAIVNTEPDKVPIDVSFLEKTPEPAKKMTVEEAILGPNYKPPTPAAAVVVAEAEPESPQSPMPNLESPTPTATDTPVPVADQHPPQPSPAEKPA